MRLHSLRLRALGPFAAEQSVDFEQLGAGGLFLLDGPTGAGKSTVLDAITFALYGPGDRGGDGRLQSHFAEAGVAPEVVLEFSVAGVRQRITRSPEFVRPKRRGGGTTTESAQVHLERLEGERWVSRSANKAEVGDIVTDEIGLNRDQFTQVVLLPQGEFMKFLRAGDDDRRTLLTRLFGTQLYDRITDELERRRKVVAGDLDEAERRVRARVSAAAEAAGLGPQHQDDLGSSSASERNLHFEELDAALAERAHRAATASASLAKQLADVRETARLADLEAARAGRFAMAVRAAEEHEATRATFEQASAVVSLADRAVPVRPLVEVLDEAVAALEAARAGLPEGVPSAAALAAQAGADQRAAAELVPLLRREQEATQLAAAAEQAGSEANAAAAELVRIDNRQAELPDLLRAAEDAVHGAETRVAGTQALHVRRDELRRRLEAAIELARVEPARAAALEARVAAFAAYEVASSEHLRLATERLDNMASELAAGLVDGEPCAVCGAVEHPHPAAFGPDAVSGADVAAARERGEDAQRHHDAAAADFARIDQRMAVLVSLVDGVARPILADQVESVEAELMTAATAAQALPGLRATRDALGTEAAALAEAARVATAQLAAAQARLEATTEALSVLGDELAEAAREYPSVAARVKALERSAAQQLELSQRVSGRDGAAAAVEAARERAVAEAVTAGFAGLGDARAALQPAEQLEAMRLLVAQWLEQAAACRGALAASEFADLDPAQASAIADRMAAAAREAVVGLAAVESAAELAAADAQRTSAAAVRFASARAEVDAAQRAYDELAEQSAPVVHLAKLARGMSGNRRVNLTTYVLRQWFEQVVAAANLRLAGMSSGRFELVRVDAGGTKSERAGLTLQVLDRHTGEQRSPRSLSGGETFYTSLALALGLADVVRAEAGGVELDTLFIDEGFGSLDADTLDQVMEVIDELRTRGRTVGIVSHVTELKHRINERIEVRKLPDGSSTLRVVA